MSETAYQPSVESHEILLLLENFGLASEGASVTSTSSVETGTLRVANLALPDLDRHWRSKPIAERSAKGSNVTIRVDLGRSRRVNFVSLHRHNIRLPFRVRFFKSALGGGVSGSPVYQSPWTQPIVRARPEDWATFSEMPWTLGPRLEDLDDWAANKRLDSFVLSDEIYSNVRAYEIEINTANAYLDSNGGASYLQMGLPMIGLAFRPRINMLLNWEMGVVDRSESVRVESGALLGRRGSIGRRLGFVLGYVDRDEAFSTLMTRWMRRHGKLGRAFVWAEPSQRRYFYDQAMVATAASLPKVAMAHLEYPAASGFVFEETE